MQSREAVDVGAVHRGAGADQRVDHGPGACAGREVEGVLAELVGGFPWGCAGREEAGCDVRVALERVGFGGGNQLGGSESSSWSPGSPRP